PSLPVVTAKAAAVPSFVSVTFAPLTTAPEGSVTVPVMEPVSTWAWSGRTLRMTPTARTKELRRIQEQAGRFMSSPLSYPDSPQSEPPDTPTHKIAAQKPLVANQIC